MSRWGKVKAMVLVWVGQGRLHIIGIGSWQSAGNLKCGPGLREGLCSADRHLEAQSPAPCSSAAGGSCSIFSRCWQKSPMQITQSGRVSWTLAWPVSCTLSAILGQS